MIAKRIYDQELIKKIMSHPKNKRAIISEETNDIDWPINDAIIYLGMFIDDIIGLFIGFVKSNVVLEVHVAMHPNYYKYTDDCYRLGFSWVKENTCFRKLVGQTPVFNKLAIKCNERNGLNREGINTKSIMKNGILYDQIYFGLNLER